MERADPTEQYGWEEVERRGSVGEKQLARMFRRYGLRFFYEHPVAVVDREKVRVWYPDFWLPDYGVAVEYTGVRDNPDYTDGVRHRGTVYRNCGIACVFVDSRDLTGCWPKRLMSDVRSVLAQRLAQFDGSGIYSLRCRE